MSNPNEKREAIIAHRVTYTCPSCEVGHLEYDGIIMTRGNGSPKYEHRCTVCTYRMGLLKVYPVIEIQSG